MQSNSRFTFSRVPRPAASPTDKANPVSTLLHRATMGFDGRELARARSLGVNGWVAEQLDPSAIDDRQADLALAAFPSLAMTGQEAFDAYPGGARFDCAYELQRSIVARAALSRRQLLERTVDFWRDHFNVFQLDGTRYVLRTPYERDVLRQHAFGNFRDLLGAVAKSAAMLNYLNGERNLVSAPNENFPRELLELHTLGVNGGYTELDISESARCFTGWRYHASSTGMYGIFTFVPAQHDTGTKTVLGTSISEPDGALEGEIVLDLAAQHPATARFVSGKLARWFLGSDVPQDTLDRAEATWNSTGGDIAEVIRTLLAERELRALMARGSRRVKRPMRLITSLMRTLTVDVTDDFAGFTSRLSSLGQQPGGWVTPDGFPDDDVHWASTATHRMHLMVDLFEGTLNGASVADSSLTQLARGLGRAELTDGLFWRLCGTRPSARDRAVVETMVAGAPAITPDVLREAVLWISLSPTFLTH